MNNNGEFTYNERPCSIIFIDKIFYLGVFKDEKRIESEKLIKLFPSNRYSDSKRMIAFDVANLLVLPNIELVDF